MKNVVVPKWVLISLVVSLISMTCLTLVSAITSYTLVKPFVVNITVQPNPFIVDALSFAYDPNTNRYTTCTVTITNSGAAQNGLIHVQLNNAEGTAIATGDYSGNIASGQSQIQVSLSWTGTATVSDVAGGWVTVTQSS